MPKPESSLSRLAVAGAYALAAALVLFPALDLIVTVLPPRPSDLSWRYALLGLTPGYVHTPLAGVGVALGVAYAMGHRRTLRVLSGLAIVSMIAFLIAMGVFALDVLQMRGLRPEQERALVLAGGVMQELKYSVTSLVLALLGIGGWRTAGKLWAADAESRAKPAAGPGIVVGGSGRES